MPLVHPTHVVSFSSEDPYHPASNLLNRETYRKWKCKDPGEKEAFVIMKFDKAVSIHGVDIGNDGSALIEVSVARSGSGGEPQFEVLVNSTAFMSPGDSREGKNLNGVRNFSLNSLSKPIAAQKWDMVKLLVSQPFNKHVQYGLTFVKFVGPPDPNEPKKIGIFGLRAPLGGKDSDSNSDEDGKPARLFSSFSMSAKKDAGSPTSSSSFKATSEEIRDTTKKILDASKASTDRQVQNLLKTSKPDSPTSSTNGSKSRPRDSANSPLLSRKQLHDPPLKLKSKDTSSPSSSSAVTSNQSCSKTPSSTNVSKPSKKRQLSPPQTSLNTSVSNSVPKKLKTTKKTKPFNSLFEGVIFAMSGFQNPLRGQIRDKAIEMGARYKADWDRTCTHLICAFYNTPKFREVRAARCGVIVRKEWIEESYRKKCRFPWRRYCLDRGDQGSESEEEIHSQPVDDEEEFEDDEDVPANLDDSEELEVKPKRKRVLVMDSESENSNDRDDVYNADTDVDDDKDKTPELSPSMLATSSDNDAPSIFENSGFYIHPKDESSLSNVYDIIINYKGQVFDALTDTTEYYICHNWEWEEEFSDALSDNPNLIFVNKNWILQCEKERRLVDSNKFLLSPK